ncbi:MAG: branched-chain amino acid ABC transporter permease [Lachnospiraceae bacterium]|nr:branched-chain amino acid ABC transporter permease [Lachnospiraceae bacterium]
MSKKTTRDLVLSILLAGAVCAVLAYCQADTSKHSYAISIIERSAVYAVVAVAMNLLNGFTGLFSLGQAGFMAIGAYVTAILTIPVEMRQNVYYMNGIAGWLENLSIPMVPAMILGGLFAAAAAALIGIPVLRLKSDYLAIATLGFAEIIRALLAAPMMDTITNGSYGLNNIPGYGNVFQPMLIAAVCIGLMVLLINSSYGRAFKAIREDDVAAEAMGINLFRHKEMSFIISSFFTGVAGGMLAVFMRSIDTKTFQVALTYNILLIVVLGGIGSVTGSIIGSFLINGGQEWLRFLDQPLTIGGVEIPLFRAGFRMVIYSILLMVVVLFWRRGIMGNKEFTWDGLFRRKRKRKETTGGEA